MFRMNHRPLREIEIYDKDTDSIQTLEVEYHNENTFSAYKRDDAGFLVTLLYKAQVEMNPDRPDDLLIRTESEQYKVDFYLDQNNNIT